MIFDFGTQTVEIINEEMTFKVSDVVIKKEKVSKLIGYSLTRPFQLEETDWEHVNTEENEEHVSITYKAFPIEAKITFSKSEDALEALVVFTNISDEEIADFAGNISIPMTDNGKNKFTLPNMIYNDNPSAVPGKIVPHIGEEAGGGIIVEEHRLPVTAVNDEWQIDDKFYFMTLFLYPQVVTGDEREYWSLGIVKEEQGLSQW